jgi:predicted nicotinamide N-methyase
LAIAAAMDGARSSINTDYSFSLAINVQINVDDMHRYLKYEIQGDQKVSVHLMITIQKVTNNVQRVPRQSPNIY